jgi:hypothetical protein
MSYLRVPDSIADKTYQTVQKAATGKAHSVQRLEALCFASPTIMSDSQISPSRMLP